MDAQLAVLVVMAVLVIALWLVPAAIEIALFRIRCRRVRRERDAVSAHRNGYGVSGGDRTRQMHALSARVRRMRVDHHDDAA